MKAKVNTILSYINSSVCLHFVEKYSCLFNPWNKIQLFVYFLKNQLFVYFSATSVYFKAKQLAVWLLFAQNRIFRMKIEFEFSAKQLLKQKCNIVEKECCHALNHRHAGTIFSLSQINDANLHSWVVSWYFFCNFPYECFWPPCTLVITLKSLTWCTKNEYWGCWEKVQSRMLFTPGVWLITTQFQRICVVDFWKIDSITIRHTLQLFMTWEFWKMGRWVFGTLDVLCFIHLTKITSYNIWMYFNTL